MDNSLTYADRHYSRRHIFRGSKGAPPRCHYRFRSLTTGGFTPRLASSYCCWRLTWASFHRTAHAVSFRGSLAWSVVWVTLALLFNYGFYRYASAEFGAERGQPDTSSRSRSPSTTSSWWSWCFRTSQSRWLISTECLFYGIVGALGAEDRTRQEPARLVDDDAASREMVSVILEYRGAYVAAAASATEARSVLSRGAYDVLLVDIAMPGEDGYTFVRRMRREEMVGARRAQACRKDRKVGIAVTADVGSLHRNAVDVALRRNLDERVHRRVRTWERTLLF